VLHTITGRFEMKKHERMIFTMLLLLFSQTVAYGYNYIGHSVTNTQYGFVNAYDTSSRIYTSYTLENMNASGVAAVRNEVDTVWVVKNVYGSLNPSDDPKVVIADRSKNGNHYHAFREQIIAK